jgi:hypothetical protein
MDREASGGFARLEGMPGSTRRSALCGFSEDGAFVREGKQRHGGARAFGVFLLVGHPAAVVHRVARWSTIPNLPITNMRAEPPTRGQAAP